MAENRLTVLPLLCTVLLTSCGTRSSHGSDETQPFAGIEADEVVHFTGTEPFWGGQVSGGTLTYETPENPNGATIAVSRFAGRNGVSYSGDLDGKPFVIAISPAQCSDGMSDRSYPYAVALQVKDEQREGCAWTDKQPFKSPKQP